MTNYSRELEKASDVSELFEIVKHVVKDFIGRERPGLVLGLAELGGQPGAFIGAFHPVGSNLIVLNKNPLNIIEHTRPEYYKYYVFHLLLHEYLHTIGILDENYNRYVTRTISESTFGRNHPVAVISRDMTRLFPEVIYASMGWTPNNRPKIEIVENFEDGNISYIG
ncbi:MAG: hypothetical protein HYW24_04750 [Candidatus Aenigmarchaeota archaeon]|nr:hypothetical protein [Candidatus Aenigmarchaeota archaeon]